MNKDLYETASQSVLRLTLRTQMIGWSGFNACSLISTRFLAHVGRFTVAELPLAERTSWSPSPATWLASQFSPSLVLSLRKYPCASWESARASSARRFASIRERVKLTRFWHLVPHLLTTLIWFPLKTWLLDMIFNSIFPAFACLETPYV